MEVKKLSFNKLIMFFISNVARIFVGVPRTIGWFFISSKDSSDRTKNLGSRQLIEKSLVHLSNVWFLGFLEVPLYEHQKMSV